MLHMIPGGAALYSPNYTGPRTLEIEGVILFSVDGVAHLLNRPKAIITMQGGSKVPTSGNVSRHSGQPCADHETRPYACFNSSAGEMGIPWALCFRQGYPPGGGSEMAAYSVQRARHEGETHRFCADLGQCGIHHPHGQAEYRDFGVGIP